MHQNVGHLECENGNLRIKKVILVKCRSSLLLVSIRILIGFNRAQQLEFNRFNHIQLLHMSISTLVECNSFFGGTFIKGELKNVLL